MQFIAYCLILPFLLLLSILPWRIGNFISWKMYVLLYYILRYRRKVVQRNLENSFPEKPEEERTKIEKLFYKHLADVFMDGFRAFTISKDELREHLYCKNPELLRRYYDEGRDVIIAVGHYNSWELFLTGLNLFIKHQAVVIYQPLSNKYLDQFMRRRRGEFNTMMLARDEVKQFYNSPRKKLSAIVYAIDQSPPKANKCYWMTFLNQETGVNFGTEKMAKDYDQPVVYARITKEKRGHYALEFVDVSSNPKETGYGEITEKVTRLLEEDIRRKPEFWLWSHKRWKKQRPAEMELH
jgi:Kdo2-lipid IVA lauroyltransferase/acyltransferase